MDSYTRNAISTVKCTWHVNSLQGFPLLYYLCTISYSFIILYIVNTRTLLTRTGYKSLTCVNHQTLHANWAWIKPKVYFIIFKRSYNVFERCRFTSFKPLTYDIPFRDLCYSCVHTQYWYLIYNCQHVLLPTNSLYYIHLLLTYNRMFTG